ncbi:MAG: hypothetical protein Q8P31_09570, partial [Bacillota bacterium]|nr:hypothetical protein [Bacillota bacterium]
MATNWKQLLTDYVDSLEGAIGAIEGATTLHNKLTAARAALLDQITALRLAELDAANLPADMDTLLARLTALRAGYLDNLSAGAVALAATALSTAIWTAARGGYLDNINQAGLLQVTAARAALLDQITALRLAELDAANIPADIDALLLRLTALRAGYLDNLSAGAVALAATALSTATWTAVRAAYLDNLLGVVSVAGSPFSLVNNVAEQDAIIVAAATQLVDIELDMINLTQVNTVREYVQVDGANYRQISAKVFPTDFDALTKCVALSFPQKGQLYK